MSTRPTLPRWLFVDANGNPRAGAKLYTYETGTSTPKPTYSDAGLTVANANPIISDADGYFSDIFLASGAYRFRLTTSADAQIWQADDIQGVGTDYVLRSGDQMSGNLTIGPQAAVNSQVTINGDLANARQAGIMLQRGGANRMLLWVNADGETGGSAGSNVELFTYLDSGVAELILSIQRATRVVTFTEIPQLPGTNPANPNDAVRFGYITPYTSPDQTLTAGGALTLAHGLGVKPALVTAGLKCISAEHGYAVDDELIGPPYYDNSASIGLCGIVPDGTNLNVRYASSFSTLVIPHKSTGARAIVTPANWRAVFRAWR